MFVTIVMVSEALYKMRPTVVWDGWRQGRA